MSKDVALSPARRRLAGMLRRLRGQAGLTGEQLAELLGTSQATVSRTERGLTLPPVATVLAWADATGASADDRDDLVDRLEAALTQVAPVVDVLAGGMADAQRRVAEVEAAATSISTFQPSVLPGLLQTGEYARRVLDLANVVAADDVAAAVEARLERGRILYQHGRTFRFVVTEAVLYWRPGPAAVLLEQLDRLSSAIALPAVELGIVPLRGEARALHTHGFSIYEGGETLVTMETVADQLTIRDEGKVALYVARFERLREAAVFGDEARAVIRRVAEDLANQ